MFERPILAVVEMAISMLSLMAILLFWLLQISSFSEVNGIGLQRSAVYCFNDTKSLVSTRVNISPLEGVNNENEPFIYKMDGENFYSYVLGKFLERGNQAKIVDNNHLDVVNISSVNGVEEYISYEGVLHSISDLNNLKLVDKSAVYQLRIINIEQENSLMDAKQHFVFTWVTD